MMKNALYVILKALFVLGVIKKIRLILKFMTSQPGQETIAIHTLPIPAELKATRQ